jgi:glycosyltransferase involved in cell wall biosynthesis
LEASPRVRIAQLAPPFESVPPTAYGGTERVVATLCNELVRLGHEVTLLAAGSSGTSARLIPTAPRPLWHYDPPLNDFGPFLTMAIDTVWDHLDEFDIVHSHLDYWGFGLARRAPAPVLTTLHGRLDLPELQPLYRQFDDVPLVSISNAQRQPVAWANFVDTVYHGIDIDEFTYRPKSDGYLAFLGRISRDKGLDTAIRVARESGRTLKVGARMPQRHTHDHNVRADWEYFEDVIQPLLKDDHVEFVGEVSGKQKDEFLGGAAALLFPIRWPEPFGLVMAEALACGAPVIALNYGSVPEVVTDGVSGFVCSSEDDLLEAIGRVDEIDRATCRAEAERRFSPAAMAAAYMTIYERLVSSHEILRFPPTLARANRPSAASDD